MSSFRIVHSLTFVLACCIVLESCCGQSNGGLPPNLQEAYHSAVGGADSQSPQPDSITTRSLWYNFVPTTPALSDVECHVEIIRLRRLGGRCTRLGGLIKPYICQSGAHFSFNPDCSRIIANRNNGHPES